MLEMTISRHFFRRANSASRLHSTGADTVNNIREKTW